MKMGFTKDILAEQNQGFPQLENLIQYIITNEVPHLLGDDTTGLQTAILNITHVVGTTYDDMNVGDRYYRFLVQYIKNIANNSRF